MKTVIPGFFMPRRLPYWLDVAFSTNLSGIFPRYNFSQPKCLSEVRVFYLGWRVTKVRVIIFFRFNFNVFLSICPVWKLNKNLLDW